jgi:hypothetical protein
MVHKVICDSCGTVDDVSASAAPKRHDISIRAHETNAYVIRGTYDWCDKCAKAINIAIRAMIARTDASGLCFQASEPSDRGG